MGKSRAKGTLPSSDLFYSMSQIHMAQLAPAFLTSSLREFRLREQRRITVDVLSESTPYRQVCEPFLRRF